MIDEMDFLEIVHRNDQRSHAGQRRSGEPAQSLQQSQGLSFKRSTPPVQAVEEHNPVQFIDQFDPILDMEHHSQAPLEVD